MFLNAKIIYEEPAVRLLFSLFISVGSYDYEGYRDCRVLSAVYKGECHDGNSHGQSVRKLRAAQVQEEKRERTWQRASRQITTSNKDITSNELTKARRPSCSGLHSGSISIQNEQCGLPPPLLPLLGT